MQISDCFEINVPNPEVKLARNTELAFIKYTGVIAFTVLLVRWMSPSQSFQLVPGTAAVRRRRHR